MVKNSTPRIYLDKVERKFLEQIKLSIPEFADLPIEVIAHDQLKKRLFEVRRAMQDGFPFAGREQECPMRVFLPGYTPETIMINTIVNNRPLANFGETSYEKNNDMYFDDYVHSNSTSVCME